MSFCGSKHRARSVAEGVVKNECFVDVLNIVPHAIFVLVSLFILIVWCKSKYYNATTWVHFRGHNVRWTCSLFLIIVIVTEISEGFMSDARDPDTVNFHVFIPPIIALIATILSLVFYHNIEQWNSPRFLLIILAYWLSVLPIKILKGISLYQNGTTSAHVRVLLTWTDVALYVILFGVEVNVLRVQVRILILLQPSSLHLTPEHFSRRGLLIKILLCKHGKYKKFEFFRSLVGGESLTPPPPLDWCISIYLVIYFTNWVLL